MPHPTTDQIMSTDLGPLYPNTHTGRPTHMSDRDAAIWSRYHPWVFQEYAGFYFDAAVGEGATVPDSAPSTMAAMWRRLTKKRIDVIGIRTDAIWIIEVRDSAGHSALGAVLTYLHLLRDNNPFSLPLTGVILTDHADKDAKRVSEAYGIKVIEI